MPQPYNLSDISSSNNLYDFMTNANILADGLMGILTLVVAFIILFMAFKQFEAKRAFAGAAFVVAILATFLRLLTWVSDTVMFTTFIMAGLSIVWLRWGD